MTQNTTNTAAFIEAEQYDSLVLGKLSSGLLGNAFYRNVAGFSMGDTWHIKTTGDVTIQDIAEDQAIAYNPIDSSEVTLTITEHLGDAFEITDELREDAAQVADLIKERSARSSQAMSERFETDLFATLNAGQTANNQNLINGHAHRRIATGGNEQLIEADIINMALAFDKANVPAQARVAIVDPVTAAAFNNLVTITDGLDRHQFFEDMRQEGFNVSDGSMQYKGNMFGFELYSSNLLPDVAAGTGIDGTNSITNAGKANIFMSILDDAHKPAMSAWRRVPRTETKRLINPPKDQFVMTARYGFGVQRLETLGVIVSDAAAVV